MAEKLKLMLKEVHWPSLIRALLIAVAWAVLPGGWFLVAALAGYLLPPVNLRRFFLLYSALILAACYITADSSWWFMPYLASGTYLILAGKELAIVDRFRAERTVIMGLMPVLAYGVFRLGIQPDSFWSLIIGPFALAGFFFLVVRDLLKEGSVFAEREGRVPPSSFAVAAVTSAVVAEAALAIVFLPVPPVIQATIFFILSAVLLELVPIYVTRDLSPLAILSAVCLGFVLLVLVFAATPIDIHVSF